ncbi:hypothetical protein ACKU5V_027450 [Klebsiella pneumoniae]
MSHGVDGSNIGNPPGGISPIRIERLKLLHFGLDVQRQKVLLGSRSSTVV